MTIHSEALSAIRALREWVKAVPADVAAALPSMPGVDGNWLDGVEARLSEHVAGVVHKPIDTGTGPSVHVDGKARPKMAEFIFKRGEREPCKDYRAESDLIWKVRSWPKEVTLFINGEPHLRTDGADPLQVPAGALMRVEGDFDSWVELRFAPIKAINADVVPASNNATSIVLSNAAKLHELSSDKTSGIFGRSPHTTQARKDCPVCNGDSGYMQAVPVDGSPPTGNLNAPLKAQYKSCPRCDDPKEKRLPLSLSADWAADGTVDQHAASFLKLSAAQIGAPLDILTGNGKAPSLGPNEHLANGQRVLDYKPLEWREMRALFADVIAERDAGLLTSSAHLSAENLFKLKLLGFNFFNTLSGWLTLYKLPDAVEGFGMDGKHWFCVHTFEFEIGRFVASSYEEAQELALNAFGRAAIPVSERLPEEGQSVLFKVIDTEYGSDKPKEFGYHGKWFGGIFRMCAGQPSFSTPGAGWGASHWLPMPPQCA